MYLLFLKKIKLAILIFGGLVFWTCQNPPDEKNLEADTLEAAENGHWKKAAKLAEKWAVAAPENAEANYQAATNYLRLNFPNKALTILENFKNNQIKNAEVGKRAARLAKAYFMTGQYSKVLEVVENYDFPKMYRGLAREHIKALVRLGQFESLEKQMTAYATSGIFRENGKAMKMDFLLRAVCNELILVNEENQLKQWIENFENWIANTEDGMEDFRNQAFTTFYLQNNKNAILLLEKAIAQEKSLRHLMELHCWKGIAHARMGALDQAELQIEEILAMENPPPRHDVFGKKNYCQARIEIALGRTDAAIHSLKKALAANTEFWSYKFKEDAFLLPLFGNSEFEKIVKIKG